MLEFNTQSTFQGAVISWGSTNEKVWTKTILSRTQCLRTMEILIGLSSLYLSVGLQVGISENAQLWSVKKHDNYNQVHLHSGGWQQNSRRNDSSLIRSADTSTTRVEGTYRSHDPKSWIICYADRLVFRSGQVRSGYNQIQDLPEYNEKVVLSSIPGHMGSVGQYLDTCI